MEFDLLRRHCLSLGFPLTEEQMLQFSGFEQALYQTNQTTNLTRVPPEQFETRHLLDSLLFLDLIPGNAELLDIGCGPGFPCWPIACARPDVKVLGMDSANKMIQFLKSVKLPSLWAKTIRAEERPYRDQFDVVTGRALAPLAIQLELSALPCRVGGAIVPMRTESEREAIEEFPAAQLALILEAIIERELPGADAKRLFPIFRKAGPTPQKYPRSWAEIRRRPMG